MTGDKVEWVCRGEILKKFTRKNEMLEFVLKEKGET